MLVRGAVHRREPRVPGPRRLSARRRGCPITDLWYQLYPLGFLGAEASNPGPGAPVSHRLRGLLPWLDHVRSLGATGLLLNPVFESSTHGYDTIDPFAVDRRLGDEADLVAVIDACHERGLRVGLDGVFHHVGRAHAAFQDVRARRESSPWASWFHLDFSHDDGADGFRYKSFEGHDALVKLDHGQPAVLDWAVDVASYWCDRGVDAWRLDAAYAVPTAFWRAFGDRLRERHPHVFLLGEVIHGDYRRFVRESGVDSVTQYELWKAIWSALNDANLFELDYALKRHMATCEGFPPWTFVGNHDVTRIASRLTHQRHLGHALAVLFSVPGIPCVYGGDELLAEGIKEDRAGGDDAVRRPPPAPATLAAGDPRLQVLALHRTLAEVRRTLPAWPDAAVDTLALTNETMAFEVAGGGRRAVVALNVGDRPFAAPLAGLDVRAGAVDEHGSVPAQSWLIATAP